MEIKRDIYLERLKAREHNGFIKIITGIRRCGKSYLLNTLFYNYLVDKGIPVRNIIKFAFDSADDLLKIGENPLSFDNAKQQRKVDPEKFLNWILPQIEDNEIYYILLDEVQELGAFESVLNGFLRKSNLDVYVTGSNSKFLSSDILTEFEGRGDEVHVLPLSFSEFYTFKGGDKSEIYDEYSIFGGLPAVALMKEDEQKVNYLGTQMQNIYLKDLIVRYNLPDNTQISEILDVIASSISSLVNPRKIASTFASVMNKKISECTVDKYIGYMEEAFMLNRVKRFDVKGRKYIGTPYKIYFEDVGLRNARLNFRQVEETHIMENIIYNELRYRGFQVDVGSIDFHEKNDKGNDSHVQREIDFVATKGSVKYYIQSAYAIPDIHKYEQEVSSFNKINDSFKKILIVGNTARPRYDENGYLKMGVKEFLLDRDSLNI